MAESIFPGCPFWGWPDCFIFADLEADFLCGKGKALRNFSARFARSAQQDIPNTFLQTGRAKTSSRSLEGFRRRPSTVSWRLSEYGSVACLPSDTDLLLTKNYSELNELCKNYEPHEIFNSLTESVFPEDFEGSKFMKSGRITLSLVRENIIGILSCQRVVE